MLGKKIRGSDMYYAVSEGELCTACGLYFSGKYEHQRHMDTEMHADNQEEYDETYSNR